MSANVTDVRDAGSTRNKPVWLLDVDGVINVDEPAWHMTQEDVAYADGRESTMRWAPQLIDEIRTLHQSGLVEVRWCTTWCDYAHQLDRLWNIPNVEPAFTNVSPRRAQTAKFSAANYVVHDEKRPLIWTDDMIDMNTLDDDLGDNDRALIISPNPQRGLTINHIVKIVQFASQCIQRGVA